MKPDLYRKSLLMVLLLILSVMGVQTANATDGTAAPTRYKDIIFSSVNVDHGVVFGQNTNDAGALVTLQMDVYTPAGDAATNRPVMILAFGGGFVGGSRDHPALVAAATDFARRGFVAASIDYRLITQPTFSADAYLIAIFRAVHDMRAAVRFFRADAAGANTYGVSGVHVFAGGASSGAVTAAFTGAFDSGDLILPSVQAWLAANGGIPGNSGGDLSYSSDINGIFSVSGAIGLTSWIDASTPPIYAAHEEFDPVVPCGSGNFGVFLPIAGGCEMVPAAQAAGVPAQLRLEAGDTAHVGWTAAEFAEIFDEAADFFYDNVLATGGIGQLAVTPATDFLSIGSIGGTFSPASKSYTLSNIGLGEVQWTATETITGMTASQTGGTLAPGASTTVDVDIDAQANAIAPGAGEAGVLTVTDTTNGVVHTRDLRIDVAPTAATNDHVAYALPVLGSTGSTTSVDMNTYTSEAGERQHSTFVTTTNGNSSWWRWTAPADGQVTFTTAGSPGETVISVYVAPDGVPNVQTLSQVIASGDYGAGSNGFVSFHAKTDITYYVAVAVADVSSVPAGVYTLSWNQSDVAASGLFASVLPGARSVQTGTTGTAFATIANTMGTTATGCNISLPETDFGSSMFWFQATDPSNQLSGTVNTPVDIPAGGVQNFIFGVTPGAELTNGADALLVFDCGNTSPAPSAAGLNSLFLSSAAAQPADMVAIASTISNDGIANINGDGGTGFFAAATINNGGPSTSITATVDTGGVSLPVAFTLCRTDSVGACINPPSPTVTFTAQTNTAYTFSVFLLGSGNVPFDPANNRAFLRFQEGAITRGVTSVAVRTQTGGT